MRARENPFRAECIESVRYHFQDGLSWLELMSRLKQLKFRAAIVGPEGSGKTTLLEELFGNLRGSGLNPVLRSAKAGRLSEILPMVLSSSDILLVDSAECLNWWEWLGLKWKARRAAGLIVTAHRPGLLPTLLQCRTTPGLFEEIASQLLGDRRFASTMLEAIYEGSDGNIRSALRALYDVCGDGPESLDTVKEVAREIVQNQSSWT